MTLNLGAVNYFNSGLVLNSGAVNYIIASGEETAEPLVRPLAELVA